VTVRPDRAMTARPTVASAMVTKPTTHDTSASVAELSRFFADDHVHAALIVSGRRLVSVVERDDLAGAGPDRPAARLGRLGKRTINPGYDLGWAFLDMLRTGRRRLAVTDANGYLVGLLCMKRSQSGFCSDRDVAARAVERERSRAR
jgi:predicted transcriptional regulator